MPVFHIFRKNNGKYYYRLMVRPDLHIILSDGYTRKKECMAAIEKAKQLLGDSHHIAIEQMDNGYYRFILTTTDKSPVGYSIPLKTIKQCHRWIDRLRDIMPEIGVLEIN